MPKLNLQRIATWPLNNEENIILDAADVFDESFIDIENYSDAENEAPNEEILSSITEVTQLKVLFRHCYSCGDGINDETVKMTTRGGILFVKFWCRKCRTTRYWRSHSETIVPKIAAACMISGNF